MSAQTNDAAFVRAAEQSLQYWTFKAARCNGVAVPIEASMYFNFRNEGCVSYAAGNPIRTGAGHGTHGTSGHRFRRSPRYRAIIDSFRA